MGETIGKYALLSLDDAALLRHCTRQVARGTGPGGQKRNKTSSAVRLVHASSGIAVEDDASRSQHQNQGHALARLRLLLAAQLPPEEPPDGVALPPVDPPPPVRSAAFPLWVARVFDALQRSGCEVRPAAAALGCSPSRLLRLVAREDALWQLFCAARRKAGLPVLRAP